MLKRILSLFLCLVMVLSILPAQTLATETESLELVVETEPVEETTAPTEAVTEPTEEVIVPTEAVTEPMEEATVPTEAVTEPTEEVAMPTEAVTESTEEVTAPTEEVADSRYWDSNLSNDNNITGYNTDDEQNDLYTYALDDNNYATITGYTGSDSVLVIPDTIDGYTVDAIGVKAFAGHSELVTVDIPDTVVVIEAAAFANCRSLTSVALSKNLTSMGAFAFYNCDALTSITIPKKLETTTQAYFAEYALGDVYGPFYGCDGLKTVTFEDGIREIANGLFANCWGLERVIIPNTVTTVEEKAFFHCENLKHLTLSTSLTTIEDRACAECTSLEAINIPDSVTEIGGGAFANCTSMQTAVLSKGLETIYAHAFYNCDALTSIAIPKKLETTADAYFAEYALGSVYGPFYGCDGLKTVSFEDGIREIANGLLANCPGLENVTIPDTVTTVEEKAFFHCENLKHLIPDTVTSVGEYILAGCPDLKTVVWTSGVSEIPKHTFAGSASVESVMIPDNVVCIKQAAFKDVGAMETIDLPESLTMIETEVFSNCDALTSIVIPDKVTTIGGNAFYDSDLLETVSIGSSVAEIGKECFFDCDALTTVTMGNSVTSIGTSVFEHCDMLKNVTLSRNLTVIPDAAFKYCAELEEITIPYYVTSIENEAFNSSPKLAKVIMPRGLTSIGTAAFSYANTTVIYGVPGTYAETWADENGFRFVAHEVTATGASLNKTTLTLHKGASEALILSVTPADSTDAITWKSSNTSVVTVTDMGVLKAVDNGTATIKVNVGGFTASCKVTVVQPVTSVSLRDPIVYLEALESFQLNATVRPNNADNQEIIWSSSDDRIVSVDENGLITGLTKGTVTITATAADGSGCSDSCTVTVNNSAYIALEPEQLESSHNYPNNCSDYWIYRKSGSETLYVLFDERTMLEDEFDYLRIYDASNELIGEYTGSALSGTTVTVPGDTVKIQIVSDESGNEWGFKVTSVYADEEYVENRVTVSPAVLEDVNSVWVDGAEYAIQKDNDYWYIDLPDGHAETMVAYTYNEGDSDDIHTQYPVSMKVWTLSNVDGYYAATRVEEFDDILQYSGASIRTAGKKGIRMITSMEQTKKNALTADVLAGYTLKEYGTVIAWAEQLGDQPLVLGASYAKSNYAYRKGVSDPVFNELDGLMQYTNVLVNFSDAQCSKDIAMRSYMILEDADGNEATLYGGIVTRSIGYIAYQNRNEFDPGTESYEYIWDIIHNVYGDIYDGEYEAK